MREQRGRDGTWEHQRGTLERWAEEETGLRRASREAGGLDAGTQGAWVPVVSNTKRTENHQTWNNMEVMSGSEMRHLCDEGRCQVVVGSEG